jgi:DNA-binding GntR family transcriptional regulator
MTGQGLKPVQLRVSSIVDAVEQSLREQILDQGIPVGAAVKETDVARTFQIARPTAKAAIERLVAAGLLRRDAHKSASVPSLSADDVNDLYLTRIVLESGMCRRLAETARVPQDALASIEDMRALPPDATPRQFVEPDIRFHTVIAEQVGGSRLRRIHSGLMEEMQLCMAQVQVHHLVSPAVIIREHKAIAAAIAKGDGDAAADMLREHLERACNALVEYLDGPDRRH